MNGYKMKAVTNVFLHQPPLSGPGVPISCRVSVLVCSISVSCQGYLVLTDTLRRNIMKLNNVLPSIPILLRESQRDKAKNETNRPIILFHFKSLTKN